MPTPEELAEDTMAYLPPSPMFEPVTGEGCVYVFGREIMWVVGIRRIDLEAARAAARTRDVPRIEWWVGPSSPRGAEEELVGAGLVPDEIPILTGMTCSTPPPPVPGVEVRAASAAEAERRDRRARSIRGSTSSRPRSAAASPASVVRSTWMAASR